MMGGMDLWYPPNDQPHLLEWWRPLLLASRAARVERFPWPLHIDEVQLVGRVDRGSRGAIWVYRHSESRGEIYIDATGQTYKYTRTPNRSEEHTSELQSLMRISYAVFCLKKKNITSYNNTQ